MAAFQVDQGFLRPGGSGAGPEGVTRAEGETERGGRGRDGARPPRGTLEGAAVPTTQDTANWAQYFSGHLGADVGSEVRRLALTSWLSDLPL